MSSLEDALIAALYRSVVDEGALLRAVGLIAERFGCRGAALLSVDAGRPAAAITLGYGVLDESAQRRYRESFAAEDPAPAAMARLPVGTATATDRLFSPAYKASSRFVREFYHPLGLDEALGGPIVDGEGRYAVLAVQRGFDRPAFSDEEIAAFQRIMPHAAQALALRRAFFEQERTARGLTAALDASPTATMLFEQGGALTHANTAARALFARGDGLSLGRDGRLLALDGGAEAQLRAALDGPCTAPQVLRLSRPGGEPPYVVKVTSAPSGRIVRVADAASPSGAAAGDVTGLLRQALDLSGPGARLVAALMAGEDLAGYAARAGLSVNTAKYHLKAAFAATGTRRQADLVRLAGAVAHDLTSPA